jgi:hypothetical protein
MSMRVLPMGIHTDARGRRRADPVRPVECG